MEMTWGPKITSADQSITISHGDRGLAWTLFDADGSVLEEGFIAEKRLQELGYVHIGGINCQVTELPSEVTGGARHEIKDLQSVVSDDTDAARASVLDRLKRLWVRQSRLLT